MTQPLLAAASKSGGRLLRPSQSVAATVRRAAEQSLFVKPLPARESVHHPGVNLVALLAPLAVMMIFGAYSAHRVAANKAADASAVAAQANGGERQAAASAMGVAPTLTALKPTAAAEPVQTSEAPSPVEPKTDAKRVTKPRVSIAPAAPAPLLEKLTASTAVAPVMEAPVPPPPNPWQSMNDSLAQCNGDLIDRVVCDLRVRQQYCNGYWGKVPQCPGGVATDHGQ